MDARQDHTDANAEYARTLPRGFLPALSDSHDRCLAAGSPDETRYVVPITGENHGIMAHGCRHHYGIDGVRRSGYTQQPSGLVRLTFAKRNDHASSQGGAAIGPVAGSGSPGRPPAQERMAKFRVPGGPCAQPTPDARFGRRPPARRRRKRSRSRRTPDRSRHSELCPHAAAGFIHFFRGEAPVLLFPQGDGRQPGPPLQCLARRAGNPCRHTHAVARGGRQNIFVNRRIYSDRKFR